MYIIPDQYKRELRVFISSTFSDMQEERDYLVKQIFPAIEQECRERNVRFTALDLRWGITEEESTSGKVVEICLDEIRRSRPFFIGLVGGRYGSIPDKDFVFEKDHIYERFPELREYFEEQRSITEIEMLYGVLAYDERVNANFFIKKESKISDEFREKDAANIKKLESLKANIWRAADQDKCRATEYGTVKQLGKQVYKQLMELVDACFPRPEFANLYDAYAFEQERFYAELRTTYIPWHFDVWKDKLLESDNVILIGNKSPGFSAFVANEIGREVELDGQTYTVFTTWLGGDVSRVEQVVRMLLHDMGRHYNVDVPELLNDEDEEIDLEALLERFPQDNRLWVIDGLERIDYQNLLYDKIAGTTSIGKVLVTCDPWMSEGAIIDNFETCAFPLFTGSMKRKVADAYLTRFRKRLTEKQLTAIVASDVISSPKTLMIFLDSIIAFGCYEKLDEYIHSLITVDGLEDFVGKILEVIENDTSPEKASKIVGRLVFSFNGQTEAQLVEGLASSTLERMALLNGILPLCEKANGRMRVNMVIKDFIHANYDFTPEEEQEFRREAIANAKDEMTRIHRRYVRKSWTYLYHTTLMRAPLVPMFAIEDQTRYEDCFNEAALQYMELGDTGNLLGMISHFNCLSWMTDRELMQQIMEYLSKNKASMADLLSSRDFWVAKFLKFDFLIEIWTAFYSSGVIDRAAFAKKVKSMWIPRKYKDKMLASLDTREISLLDLWDENDPDTVTGNMNKLIQQIFRLIFVVPYDELQELRGKIKRTLENMAVGNSADDAFYSFYKLIDYACALGLDEPQALDDDLECLSIMPEYMLFYKTLAEFESGRPFDAYLERLQALISGKVATVALGLRLVANLLENLGDMGKFKAVIEESWEECLSYNDRFVMWHLGFFFARYGYSDEAVAIFAKYDEDVDLSGNLRYSQIQQVIKAYIKKDMFIEALDYLEAVMLKVAESQPMDADRLFHTKFTHAILLFKCGKSQEAVSVSRPLYEQAQGQYASYKENLARVLSWSLGNVAMNVSDLAERASMLRESIILSEEFRDSSNPEYWRSLVAMLLELSKIDRMVLPELAELLESVENNSEIIEDNTIQAVLSFGYKEMIINGYIEPYLEKLKDMDTLDNYVFPLILEILKSENSQVKKAGVHMLARWLPQESGLSLLPEGGVAEHIREVVASGNMELLVQEILHGDLNDMSQRLWIYAAGYFAGRDDIICDFLHYLREVLLQGRSLEAYSYKVSFMEQLQDPTEEEIEECGSRLLSMFDEADRIKIELDDIRGDILLNSDRAARYAELALAWSGPEGEDLAYAVNVMAAKYEADRAELLLQFLRSLMECWPQYVPMLDGLKENMANILVFALYGLCERDLYDRSHWDEAMVIMDFFGLEYNKDLLSLGIVVMNDDELVPFYIDEVEAAGNFENDFIFAGELHRRKMFEESLAVTDRLLAMETNECFTIDLLIIKGRSLRSLFRYEEGLKAFYNAIELYESADNADFEFEPIVSTDVFVYLSLMVLLRRYGHFEMVLERFENLFDEVDRWFNDLLRCVYYYDVDNEQSAERLWARMDSTAAEAETPDDVKSFSAWFHIAKANYCGRHGKPVQRAQELASARRLLDSVPADSVPFIRRLLAE